MPSKVAFGSLAILVLALAACGKQDVATTAPAPTTAPATTTALATSTPPPSQRPVQAATYTIRLAGIDGGAPNGSGLAVFTVNPSTDELCWTFSQLKNIGTPTAARIYRWTPAGTGRYGPKLSSPYKPSGCVRKGPGFLNRIAERPQEWYLNIHSVQFPNGAVRGTF